MFDLKKAVVVRSNEIVTVDPRSVLINEIIEIKAGERVPFGWSNVG